MCCLSSEHDEDAARDAVREGQVEKQRVLWPLLAGYVVKPIDQNDGSSSVLGILS